MVVSLLARLKQVTGAAAFLLQQSCNAVELSKVVVVLAAS
jgi:hypothetical protein